MVEAEKSSSSSAAHRQRIIELGEVLMRLIPDISDREARQARSRESRAIAELKDESQRDYARLLIGLPEPLISGWTYVVQPQPINLEWWKRESAIEQIDKAVGDGDFDVFMRHPETGELIQVLPSQWRQHGRGWHREIIIAGTMRASACDELLPYNNWRVVLLRNDFDVWRDRRARRAATSVREAPAAVERSDEQAELGTQGSTSAINPVEPAAAAAPKASVTPVPVFEATQAQSIDTIEQRSNSESLATGATHPGDSPPEACTRKFLRRAMKQDPENKSRQTKADLKDQCQSQCGEISNRAFEEIWATCIDETGAVAYKRPGPRGEHKAPRRSK